MSLVTMIDGIDQQITNHENIAAIKPRLLSSPLKNSLILEMA
jgi:hypothetical protein